MTKPSSFSLITYNIHKGFGVGKLRFLLPEMREALITLNPDLVFLQEVQGKHLKRAEKIAKWPRLPQFEYLAKNTWSHYLYAQNAVYRFGHHGNAILSKFPFTTSHNINLSKQRRASRSLLHGQIPSPTSEETLHLICIHLGLFKKERALQCKMLIARIKEAVPMNEPLIIAGDFNDWRLHLSKPLFEELGLIEAFHHIDGEHARSFPALTPAFCVDRIYFRGLKINEVTCLSGKPWRNLSDHLPLYANFSFLK